MNMKQRFKQLDDKNEGWIEYNDYKKIVTSRDWINFLTNNTNESCNNLLEKGK